MKTLAALVFFTLFVFLALFKTFVEVVIKEAPVVVGVKIVIVHVDVVVHIPAFTLAPNDGAGKTEGPHQGDTLGHALHGLAA
jgi:hypothetical protein